MFHVKDAEFNPTGKQGVYGGYQNWINRAGRFRSLGTGRLILNLSSANLLHTIIGLGCTGMGMLY